jgi:hypothetical protein
MAKAISAIRSPQVQVSYNHDVRRILAISLLLLFSVTLISPLFALSTDAGGNLPACCRRNGTHHCALMTGEQSQGIQFSALQQRCPAYPRAITLNRRNEFSLKTSTDRSVEIVVHASGKTEATANAKTDSYGSQQQRGPPVLA